MIKKIYICNICFTPEEDCDKFIGLVHNDEEDAKFIETRNEKTEFHICDLCLEDIGSFISAHNVIDEIGI